MRIVPGASAGVALLVAADGHAGQVPRRAMGAPGPCTPSAESCGPPADYLGACRIGGRGTGGQSPGQGIEHAPTPISSPAFHHHPDRAEACQGASGRKLRLLFSIGFSMDCEALLTSTRSSLGSVGRDGALAQSAERLPK